MNYDAEPLENRLQRKLQASYRGGECFITNGLSYAYMFDWVQSISDVQYVGINQSVYISLIVDISKHNFNLMNECLDIMRDGFDMIIISRDSKRVLKINSALERHYQRDNTALEIQFRVDLELIEDNLEEISI
mgnify:CR=1 FL=1